MNKQNSTLASQRQAELPSFENKRVGEMTVMKLMYLDLMAGCNMDCAFTYAVKVVLSIATRDDSMWCKSCAKERKSFVINHPESHNTLLIIIISTYKGRTRITVRIWGISES